MSRARCEGWRRHGGMMTFGRPEWKQCENASTVMLTVVQERKTKTLPACPKCWAECIERGIRITKAVPVRASKGRKHDA